MDGKTVPCLHLQNDLICGLLNRSRTGCRSLSPHGLKMFSTSVPSFEGPSSTCSAGASFSRIMFGHKRIVCVKNKLVAEEGKSRPDGIRTVFVLKVTRDLGLMVSGKINLARFLSVVHVHLPVLRCWN